MTGLSRLGQLGRMGRQRIAAFGGASAPTAPDAFTAGQWTAAATGVSGVVRLTISALPSANGSAITDIEYRIDGGAAQSTGLSATGTYDILALVDDVEVDIEIRAVNAIGDGAWSDVKARTPIVLVGTSSTTANNAENSVLAHALTANMAGTWTLVGGADQARFEVSGSTLRWLSNGTKDFEAPDDVGSNNTYVAQVRITNSFGTTADQTITITVTDVVEAANDNWALEDDSGDWVLEDDSGAWILETN